MAVFSAITATWKFTRTFCYS